MGAFRDSRTKPQYLGLPVLVSALSFDRIFCWPSGAMRASFVDRAARTVSDHLPVVADIDVS
jgi:endonuclease/exonuclease/phosphatase family metal-dependent hydrolase